jgi:hypothetical protein
MAAQFEKSIITMLRPCVFYTLRRHGEPAASDTLRQRIANELDRNVHVPEYRDDFDLG